MAGAAGKVETKAQQPSPAKAAAKKTAKKPFVLDSPFSDPAWPKLSTEHGDIVMELLCRLLEPIGTHRTAWTKPSKGKRDRKRKRGEPMPIQAGKPGLSEAESSAPPSPPEISQHIVVGFNAVVRCLDPAARNFIDQPTVSADQEDPLKLAPIFVDQSIAPEILWSQLPFLTMAAEMRDASYQARIVPLARGSAVRLSEVLGIPRAGIVGVGADAPEAASLLSFVQEHVPVVDIPWLKSEDSREFQPTSVGVHAGPSFRKIEKT